MYVIEQYAATIREKDTIWMVFNRTYNNIHAFKLELTDEMQDKYLQSSETDENAKEEFLMFMKNYFPKVPLVEVGDLVSTDHIIWPYLGSIAIDADIESDVYFALCEKYGDPHDDPITNNACLWLIDYNDAQALWKDREQSWENP